MAKVNVGGMMHTQSYIPTHPHPNLQITKEKSTSSYTHKQIDDGTLMHLHTLSLSCAHAHAHPHCLSVSLSLCLSVSLSLSHAHTAGARCAVNE